jgi:glycosyltransferase involved in cell wall biosynthesis
MQSELIIVIPVFNEEKTLRNIILRCKNHGDLIFINDCSTDKSIEIIKKYKVKSINHKSNLGYEASILSGFLYAKKKNYKYLIFIDADGELPVRTLKKVKKLLKKNNDIVTGVRDRKNRILEKLFSLISFIFWNIRDPMCGMKGYNIKKIYNIKKNFTTETFATEILFRLLKNKYSIKQIPIKVQKRKNNSKVGNGLKIQIMILKSIFLSVIIKLIT